MNNLEKELGINLSDFLRSLEIVGETHERVSLIPGAPVRFPHLVPSNLHSNYKDVVRCVIDYLGKERNTLKGYHFKRVLRGANAILEGDVELFPKL